MRYDGLLGGKVLSFWKQGIWVTRASKITLHCAKHNQHANASGIWGMPPRKFLKIRCSEIESEAIYYMHVI